MIPVLTNANPDPFAGAPGTVLDAEIMQPLMEVRDAFENTINVARFNRDDQNEERLNATTINAAIEAAAGEVTFFLRRGVWEINEDVDMSSLSVRLVLEPGVVLIQAASFTFKFPRNFVISDDRAYFSGAAGFVVFPVRLATTLKPQWWGATPHLVASDSTAALIAFTEACYEADQKMVLPSGYYGFSGTWTLRNPMVGFDVTIAQRSADVQSSVGDSTLRADNISGFSITGHVFVNSDHKRVGIFLYQCDGAHLEGLRVLNSVHAGVYLSRSHSALVSRCYSSFVLYGVVPSTGGAADGFYHRECRNVRYEDCGVYDVRRIGFTSEGTVGLRSEEPVYVRCTVEYAHDSDDSTDQHNGAFWLERTNGGTLISCMGINIDSGEGQTTRRAQVFTLGGATSRKCTFTFQGCGARGNTATTPGAIMYSLSGNDAHALVQVLDTSHCEDLYQGVLVAGGLREVTVRGLCAVDFVEASSNSAAIVVNSDSSLLRLTVDGISETGCTWHANSGTILFLAAATNCAYTLRNAMEITHACNISSGNTRSMVIEGGDITFGATSRASFTAVQLKVKGAILRERAGGNGRLFRYTGTDEQNSHIFEGCTYYFSSGDGMRVDGSVTNLQVIGGHLYGGGFDLRITGKFVAQLLGVNFLEYSATMGAVYANSTVPTRGVVHVRGCNFSHTSNVTPLKKNVQSPTMAILEGNTHTSTALTDWDNVHEQGNEQVA